MTKRSRLPKREINTLTYEVTVWDHEGNIVKKLWDATIQEADAVRDEFEDDPFRTVVVEER